LHITHLKQRTVGHPKARVP